MPIREFAEDQVFDPEMIAVMRTALVDACASLGLRHRADLATELVARKVIELAKAGERDPARLKTAVLQAFQHN